MYRAIYLLCGRVASARGKRVTEGNRALQPSQSQCAFQHSYVRRVVYGCIPSTEASLKRSVLAIIHRLRIRAFKTLDQKYEKHFQCVIWFLRNSVFVENYNIILSDNQVFTRIIAASLFIMTQLAFRDAPKEKRFWERSFLDCRSATHIYLTLGGAIVSTCLHNYISVT